MSVQDMNDKIRAAGAGAGTGARGLLSFAGLHLVLAPGDLRMIEASEDLMRTDPPARGIGWIAVFEQWWPVYSLSFDLKPLADEAPAARRMCAVLGHSSGLYGLLCNDIQVMRGVGPTFRPIPLSVRGPGSPIQDLAADSRGVLCGTDAEMLGRFIGVENCLDRQRAA